jgi:DNA invertase Pin-like site-specific DNA recombinase
MNAEAKVTAEHLQRWAYLYIRQSTLRQVLENTESTQRQYALRRRALALGWPEERIIVIDHDQGQSGASTVDREGFQRLVTEVGLGKAGIVMGLEVSRPGPQLRRLASAAGDLRAGPHADPGRRRTLRPGPL